LHRKILEKKISTLRDKEKFMMEKYGWVVHFVFDTNGELDGLANIHTHGLLENFNHKDFQIVLPLDSKDSHPLLVGIVNQIKDGRKFEADIATSNVIYNYDVFFKEFKEKDRTVLRLILPDPNGKFPNEKDCIDPYNRQLELLKI
jgi:hypothetical protein